MDLHESYCKESDKAEKSLKRAIDLLGKAASMLDSIYAGEEISEENYDELVRPLDYSQMYLQSVTERINSMKGLSEEMWFKKDDKECMKDADEITENEMTETETTVTDYTEEQDGGCMMDARNVKIVIRDNATPIIVFGTMYNNEYISIESEEEEYDD